VKDKFDETNSKVLNNLHKKPDFTAADGWSMEVWERTLDLGGEDGLRTYKVKYMVNSLTGTVITSQRKAWNDQICYCVG